MKEICMHLTTAQRILIHLSRFTGKGDRWEAPYEVSQAGISSSLHIPQSTVSRVLKSLREEGMIEDRVMYVRGEKRKKSAYFLTTKGIRESEHLVNALMDETVNVLEKGEAKTLKISDAVKVLKEKGIPAHPLEIHELFEKNGIVDMDSMRVEKTVRFHVPFHEGVFAGRKDVIEEIMRSLGNSQAILIKGMAGMGKSALLSELAQRLSEKYHIFWYTMRRGRGLFDLTREINAFLRETGRRPVERRLGAIGFFREMRDVNAILMLDDLHFADEETVEFLRTMAEMMFTEPCSFRVVGSSREDLGIFRKVDVAKGKIHEIVLQPLKKEEIRELFPDEDIEKIYSLTGGIPLFVQLYRNAGFRLSDAERIVEEEVLSSLSESEKLLLRTLSVHRIPVYPEAIIEDDHAAFENLLRKLMIFEVETGKIDMHDVLRDIIYKGIPVEERKRLHAHAAEYYLSQWCEDRDRFEAVYHLQMAEEWERAAKIALSLASIHSLDYSDPALSFAPHIEKIPENLRGELLILIGDILSHKGMWDKAIDAYREAQEYLGDIPEIKERIASANLGMERWEESLRMEKELLDDAKSRKDRHDVAKHLVIIGNIYLRSENPKKAIESYSEALPIIKSMKYREGIAVVENNIGSAYIRIGDLGKAEKHILESLKYSRYRGKIGMRALSNLGYIYELKGDVKSSEKAYRKAMELSKDERAKTDLIERLVYLMINDGRWGEAIALAKRSEDKVPEDERWRILEGMADAYRKGKMYDDAVKTRIRVLNYTNRAEIRLELAEDLIMAGRIAESLQIIDEELERAVPWEQERRMRALELRGRALLLGGNRDEAVESYMEAIKIAEDIGAHDVCVRLRRILEGL